MLFIHNFNRIDYSLKIALLRKGCPQIRHDEISHEHHALIRQIDEHGVASFSSMHGNQFNTRPPNLQVRAAVDRHIRLKAAHVVETEAFTEELLTKISRRIEVARNFFLIVAPGIET